ncbi:MAG: peptidylprolyl isomerase [Planctomycetota bacterium]
MIAREPKHVLALAVTTALLVGVPRAQVVPVAPQDPSAGAEQEDPVIAKVGDQELRQHDLIAELNRQIPLTYYHAKVPEKQMLALRRKSFDQLVERSLVHQDAIARGIEVGDEEVVDEFRRALRSSEEFEKVGPERLEAEVKKLLPQFRPLVIRRLLIDKNEARFRSSVPKPDDAAVQAVYERMLKDSPETLQAPAEAHLQHIYVAVDPAGGDKAAGEKQKKIDAAKAALAAGKPFEDVARQFSEDESAKNGGELGTVKAGFFKSSEIERVAFALEAGQVSEVFRSLYGFHIIRCLDVAPRRNLTIEETRKMLEQWFVTEHTQKRRIGWMMELRARYKVEVFADEFAENGVPGQASEPIKGKPYDPAAHGRD